MEDKLAKARLDKEKLDQALRDLKMQLPAEELPYAI